MCVKKLDCTVIYSFLFEGRTWAHAHPPPPPQLLLLLHHMHKILFTRAPPRDDTLLMSTVRTTREPHPYAKAEEPLTLCQRICFYIFVPLLSPLLLVLWLLRAVSFFLLMLALLVPCNLALMGLPDGQPVRGWRRSFSKAAVGIIGRGCLATFGCWWGNLTVRGEWDPTCPVIVCAPHVGMTDAYLWMVLGFPRPIIMEAYTKIPVVKTLLRVAGALVVPVPSSSTIGTAEGAKATLAATAASDAPKAPSATAAVREKILEHKRTFQPGVDDAPIALFPEGITHNGRTILGFFPGAFEGGSSVQPVVLQYKYRHFNMHAFLSTLPEHLLSLFANPSLVIEVDFLPALLPNEAQKADGKLLADAARASMARASGMALHEMSAKDLRDELKIAAEKARREKEMRLEKEKQKAAGARGEEPMLL